MRNKIVYKIQTPEGVREVEGRPIEVYSWIKTFLHRGLSKKTHAWVICETSTGLSISSGDTQKQAVERAKYLLDTKTKEKTLEFIEKGDKINDENNLKTGLLQKNSDDLWEKMKRG